MDTLVNLDQTSPCASWITLVSLTIFLLFTLVNLAIKTQSTRMMKDHPYPPRHLDTHPSLLVKRITEIGDRIHVIAIPTLRSKTSDPTLALCRVNICNILSEILV